MVTLDAVAQKMLLGKEGPLKQAAMQNIVRYAEILGAEELCKVTKATLFCGKHNYLSVCPDQDFDTIFTKMQLGKDQPIVFDAVSPNCQVQSCVSPCERTCYSELGQSQELFTSNVQFLERAKAAGVTIAGTCAPYLNGWIPLPGEHFVTTESGVTILGNSLYGACCNSDGIEATFWSAICGYTAKWGNHLKASRAGNIGIKVDVLPESYLDWEILGKAIGDNLPVNSIPIVEVDASRLNFNKLRQFLTALAVSSNCELCHIVGVTPEARSFEDAAQGKKIVAEINIGKTEMQSAYEMICSPGASDVSLVSLGCPHYDIEQIKYVAALLADKKVNNNVDFQVWTAYPIKHMAEINGYASQIAAFGGKIYTDTCPTTIGKCFLDTQCGMVFDSIKQCGSVKSSTNVPGFYGSIENAIKAAQLGRWEESMRWCK